jgi:hypothetical protein
MHFCGNFFIDQRLEKPDAIFNWHNFIITRMCKPGRWHFFGNMLLIGKETNLLLLGEFHPQVIRELLFDLLLNINP